MLDDAVAAEYIYPAGRFKGRGIVICGGGLKYFPCTWVCLNILRQVGCQLPVEVWYLGEKEMSRQMLELLSAQGAQCIDAEQVRERNPARILNGWELKPYALIHSRFEEVLLLDADNVPITDPEYLFDEPKYQQTGAVFWPDFGQLAPEEPIWEICRVNYREEPEFESGQIILNKGRCWKALQVTMHMNEYSDFYFSYILGDKETFHMAWRRLGQEYAMPAREIEHITGTMCQHDFDGDRIFQHRNMDKWKIGGTNQRIAGFALEEDCFSYLEELAKLWTDLPFGVRRWRSEGKSTAERGAALELCQTMYCYCRVGYDERPMAFHPDGSIGEGAASCEVYWNLRESNGHLLLGIYSNHFLTCELQRNGHATWIGRWEHFEKMPIELCPIAQTAVGS